MGLEELYAETAEIYQTINEVNQTLNMPYIEKPIYDIPQKLVNKTVNNVVEIATKKTDFFAKEISKSISGKRPDQVVVGIAFGLAFSVVGAVAEVGIGVTKDVIDNVAVKNAAKNQLIDYKKVLATKCSLIIKEHQKLIKEKIQTKNDEKEKQRELEERIVRLSTLIEKCNSLLNK